LGGQVRKWRPKVRAVATKLAKVTGDTFDDIVQDFLAKIWQDVEYWKTPQVRYHKQIWEILSEEMIEGPVAVQSEELGSLLNLRRTAKAITTEIWISRSEVEEIKKTSLGTFVYSGIKQFYIDRLSTHFTAKNGYVAEVDDVTSKKTQFEGKEVIREYKNYTKVSGVSLAPTALFENGLEVDVVDLQPSHLDSPEDDMNWQSLIDALRSRISPEAKSLLSFFLQEDEEYMVMMDLEILRLQSQGSAVPSVVKLDELAASKFFSKTRAEIKALKVEIIEALPAYFLQYILYSKGPLGERKRTQLVLNAIQH
jgi:hypothetical protein